MKKKGLMGMEGEIFNKYHKKKENEIINQLCECCNKWANQMDLVWDLDEDRLVCIHCLLDKSNN